MDEYYLSREDWDTLVELGLGEQRDDAVLKKIATATKTALTRKYNQHDHPIAFHRAQELGKPAKKIISGPAPDLEDALNGCSSHSCAAPRRTGCARILDWRPDR